MSTRSLSYDESRILPMAAGILLLSLAAFTLLYFSQNASVLKMAYPVASLVLGIYLYAKHLPLFLGFTWTLWFITPFVRRFIDFLVGYYDPSSLAMLTPFLVTGLTLITVLRYGRRLTERAYRPFVLVLLGVLFGYIVGIVYQGISPATLTLPAWIVPIFLGFHILVYWQEYPRHRQILRGTFTCGVLVMGLYGIFQFFAPPGWDVLWLVGSEMDSVGQPEPLGLRVFSTLNAPGPFALTMMSGLLLLFDGRRSIHRVAAVPGYVAFLLTNVRAAWGGWIVALVLVILRLRGRMKVRMIAIVALSAVLLLPFVRYDPVSERVGGRAETLGNVAEDGSFQARLGLYRSAGQLLSRPLGTGLGAGGVDSGILSIPHVLGWIGSLLYFAGLLWLVKKVVLIKDSETDQFSTIAGAIATTFVILLVIANQVIGIKGALLWTFLCIALAGQMYYRERILKTFTETE